MALRFPTLIALGLILAAGRVLPSAAAGTSFSFGALDPVNLSDSHRDQNDYMQLFAADAPWEHGEARLSAFKISAQLILRGGDDMLRTIFETLHRRHIAVEIEMGAVLQQPSEQCGGGEGYMQPGVITRIGKRLTAMGYAPDIMAMDGPVWLTHERSWGISHGRPDCQYTVREVAQRAAQSIATMRQYFSALRVGEIEAVNSRLDARQVLADYAEFARLVAAATGQNLAFLHCDTAWQSNWLPIMAPLRQQTHALGMRFGVIIGGSPEDPTDEAWVANGLRRLRTLESDPATVPDDVIAQSWQKLPTRVLPETQPGTSTYMLLEAERIVRQ